MKKLLLIPALLLSSVVMATDYNYEITPVIGYNIAEGNLNLDDYTTYGVELQYNGFDFPIKPELSLLSAKADFEDSSEDTKVCRAALNGVYEFDKVGIVTPLAKAGLGYENMSDPYTIETKNTNSAFVDAGVGAKVAFTDWLALKLEAVYMLKYNHHRYDSNLAVLAGLNFAFGAKSQPVIVEEVVEKVVVVAPVVVVVLDDDKDGIANEQDKCPTTPAGKQVNYDGCCVDLDDDKDGVLNSKDECPSTLKGVKVDAKGCKVIVDTDGDGVFDLKDLCPDTPIGESVNNDGCPVTLDLNVNFENNSFVVDAPSQARVQKYADFLSKYTNYSTIIVGHTDSRGSAAYNKSLSQKRAKAVAALLVKQGAPAENVASDGMGEAEPTADNATKEGRAKNRRIEAELTRN